MICMRSSHMLLVIVEKADLPSGWKPENAAETID